MVWVSLSFLGSDCMPSGREVAGATLMASPFAFLGGLFLLLMLRKLWEPLYEPRPVSSTPQLAALVVLLSFSLAGYFVYKGAADLAYVALWAFGTSYASVLLIVWRIWFHKAKDASFSRAPIVSMAVLLLPAPVLLWGNLDENTAVALYMIPWMWPGLLGYVTVPLFLIALGEAIVRRVRKNRAAQSEEKALEE